jgi:hypothetical protein
MNNNDNITDNTDNFCCDNDVDKNTEEESRKRSSVNSNDIEDENMSNKKQKVERNNSGVHNKSCDDFNNDIRNKNAKESVYMKLNPTLVIWTAEMVFFFNIFIYLFFLFFYYYYCYFNFYYCVGIKIIVHIIVIILIFFYFAKDEKLVQSVERFSKDFRKVSNFMEVSKYACEVRWKSFLDPNLKNKKNGAWSEDEVFFFYFFFLCYF